MNKETFIQEIKDQEAIISHARLTIEIIRSEYFKTSSHLELGQKVTIVSKEHSEYDYKLRRDVNKPQSERFAFLSHIQLVNSDGTYKYSFDKIKKDGSRSSISDYIKYYEYVKELA